MDKQVKRVSAIAAVLAGMVVLAACSSSSSSGGSPAGGSSPGGSKGTVAFSFPTQDVDIWQAQLNLMKPILAKAGYDLTTDNPNWNLQSQVNDWQSWITGGSVKAIMGFPIQENAFVPVTAQAKTAGIPVIGYSEQWSGAADMLQLDTVGAGKDVGLAAGRWMIKTYGKTAPVKVGLLADTTSDLGRTQLQGMQAGLKASGANAVVFKLEANSRDQALNDAQSQLTAHPDTKAFLGISADMALGARQALIAKGVKATNQRYYIGATDVSNEGLNLIKTGTDMWQEAYVWSAPALAQADATLLINAAEGKPAHTILLGVQKVNAANASQFYIK